MFLFQEKVLQYNSDIELALSLEKQAQLEDEASKRKILESKLKPKGTSKTNQS
jgi:hypothetical protein